MGYSTVVEGTQSEGYVVDLVPELAQELSWASLVSREVVEEEIDLILRAVREFWNQEPDQVMRSISLLSSRCTEMEVHLHRLEGKREWKQLRTMQVQKILLELDRQFKISSRMVEIRKQDMSVEGIGR